MTGLVLIVGVILLLAWMARRQNAEVDAIVRETIASEHHGVLPGYGECEGCGTGEDQDVELHHDSGEWRWLCRDCAPDEAAS
jgi:hypothetical protein